MCYTPCLLLQLVYDKWCKVLDTVPDREKLLTEEMMKQQTNEQLRVAFAEKANALAVYIQGRASELAEQSMKALGTMEVYMYIYMYMYYIFYIHVHAVLHACSVVVWCRI